VAADGLDDFTDSVRIDPEALVDEDVAKATDLRPGDLRVRTGDVLGEMVHGFADDLRIAIDRVCEYRGQDRPLQQMNREHIDIVLAEEHSSLLHQSGGPHLQVPVFRCYLHQDVDVGPRFCGTTSNRSEEPRIGYAVPVEKHLELHTARVEELAQSECLGRRGDPGHALRVPVRERFDGSGPGVTRGPAAGIVTVSDCWVRPHRAPTHTRRGLG
jgi:hypothetical protein